MKTKINVNGKIVDYDKNKHPFTLKEISHPKPTPKKKKKKERR